MPNASVQISLPDWLHELDIYERLHVGAEAQVALAIELSALNIANQSGGPFGAAIFDAEGRLLGAGVNRVVPQSCSVAHAEMMAFMTAQHRLQRFRLNESAEGIATGPITLATSAQPCCMCYGASFWAGIDNLLIGARAEDVMALTEFDEGPLPADWIGELEQRGIRVQRDLLRDTAREVLRRYGESGAKY